MSGLLDTPEGFVWLFDRRTLATLPAADQERWRDFHETVWEQVIYDPSVHEGCAPADELHAAQRDVIAAERDGDVRAAAAKIEGYRLACTDIRTRLDGMKPNVTGEKTFDTFEDCRVRMIEGIHRLHERGPKIEETT